MSKQSDLTDDNFLSLSTINSNVELPSRLSNNTWYVNIMNYKSYIPPLAPLQNSF